MTKKHNQLLSLLEETFNSEGDIHFLAVAEKEIQIHGKERPVHQVRVALTFQEGDKVNPYFDGTDLFVSIGDDSIKFILEKNWADGPPAMEGSPIELALGWVSQLAEPFFISSEALESATVSDKLPHRNNHRE